jgi:Family of unknown function (DUF6172)
MKKTFPLQLPGHAPARVLEGIKGDVRKYFKREKRKPTPTGVDFWNFACKVGADTAEPESKHPKEVVQAIDAAAQAGASSVYVEILAIPGHRMKKAAEPLAECEATPVALSDATPTE